MKYFMVLFAALSKLKFEICGLNKKIFYFFYFLAVSLFPDLPSRGRSVGERRSIMYRCPRCIDALGNLLFCFGRKALLAS